MRLFDCFFVLSYPHAYCAVGEQLVSYGWAAGNQLIAFSPTAFLQQVKEDEWRMEEVGGGGPDGREGGNKLCRFLVPGIILRYYL